MYNRRKPFVHTKEQDKEKDNLLKKRPKAREIAQRAKAKEKEEKAILKLEEAQKAALNLDAKEGRDQKKGEKKRRYGSQTLRS